MSLITILIAIPIFVVAYQAVGLALESRRTRISTWSGRRSNSSEALRQFASTLSKFGFNKLLLENKRYRERLDLLTMRSGYAFGWKAEDLLFFKELSGIAMLIFMWYGQTDNILIWIGGAYAGFLLPEVLIKAKGAARMLEIQRALPGFVDLAVLALEGGLDLLAAIERIATKMKPSAIREELQTLIQENRLGTPRKEALQHLAYRVNLQDVQSLTSIIIQSEELGTSLAPVMRAYAEDMRNRRLMAAEEVAGKAPVKLLFPMMVFFFPVVFVIIFGPLAMNLMSTVSK